MWEIRAGGKFGIYPGFLKVKLSFQGDIFVKEVGRIMLNKDPPNCVIGVRPG